jgi:predicted RNase H-like nuclease/ppGpp synthetase/RelA/SpoT-type nucleotidyltranferase
MRVRQSDPVHYVGIDLAWGLNRPTGLAVLDESGRLEHLSVVRTDEEIAGTLSPFVAGPCLAGIDAPLVVTNATGSRPAEQALSKDFRRYEAGTHPSNTGKPEFAEGTRGGRVCALLGLDLDPDSTADRRALEVYPHPAQVVLFGLERTLKYKQKQGRDLELLRRELLTLMDHVERVVDTGGPAGPWAGLRASVVAAARKSDLRVVEDQVDAVICAYVALFADRWPERTTRYGDLATGYIVTPSLVTDVAAAAVRAYAADHARLEKAGREAVERVVGILDEAGINYLSVGGRAKSIASFAEKASRTRDGRPLYPDPLRDIGDLLGVRVITFVAGDVEIVADLLAEQLVVRDDRDLGELTASEGRFGYASRHLQVEVDGHEVQVQLRTVLQHAWAEFEHDIRYKGSVPPEHASEFDRRFTLAAGLLELADREFSAIRDRLRGPAPAAGPADALDDDDPRIAPRELAAFLAGQYADAGWSRTDHYAWISGLLLELGIASLAELAEVLRSTDDTAIQRRMDYRYPPAAVRRLDDALLTAYGDRYVALRGNEHRQAALQARLEKLLGERGQVPRVPRRAVEE